jgi:hypothetical protein
MDTARYKQFRLALKSKEYVIQTREVKVTYSSKWYRPWDYTATKVYGEWEDLPTAIIDSEGD